MNLISSLLKHPFSHARRRAIFQGQLSQDTCPFFFPLFVTKSPLSGLCTFESFKNCLNRGSDGRTL